MDRKLVVFFKFYKNHIIRYNFKLLLKSLSRYPINLSLINENILFQFNFIKQLL